MGYQVYVEKGLSNLLSTEPSRSGTRLYNLRHTFVNLGQGAAVKTIKLSPLAGILGLDLGFDRKLRTVARILHDEKLVPRHCLLGEFGPWGMGQR